MQNNRYKYFRWAGQTARISFAYMVAFPAFVGYWGYVTDVSEHFIRMKKSGLGWCRILMGRDFDGVKWALIGIFMYRQGRWG